MSRAVETQFERELRRRGMDGSGPGDSYASAPRSPGEQQVQQQRTGPRPPPSFQREAEDDVPPQLKYSRALNSEGLEVRRQLLGRSAERFVGMALLWRSLPAALAAL